MTGFTAEGQRAHQILDWVNDDQQARITQGMDKVNTLALSLMQQTGGYAYRALAEVQDVGTVLARLEDAYHVTSPQFSDDEYAGLFDDDVPPMPLTISGQVDLAAIAGRHIPGTQYTYRHGWIPIVGQLFNDKYPAWLHQKDAEARAQATPAPTAAGPKPLTGKEAPAPPSAASRKLTPEQKAMVAAHKAQVARAQRAAQRALSPSTPTPMRAAGKLTQGGAMAPTIGHISAGPEKPSSGAASRAAEVFAAHPEATAVAEQRADTVKAAVASLPDFKPGTVGANLKESDPGLASLAAPGASMAAMKAYIDAKVATEVARQVKQITDKQQADIDAKLAELHKGQQKMISHIRKTVQTADDQETHQDRTHLVMYNLFNLAGLGLTIGGLASGMNPIVAAMASFAVPLATTIHDYVRSM